jgi:hypothetical protein
MTGESAHQAVSLEFKLLSAQARHLKQRLHMMAPFMGENRDRRVVSKLARLDNQELRN